MNPDLILIRMRLTGGKEVAAEGETAAKGIAAPGEAAAASAAKTSTATTAIGASMRKQSALMRTFGRAATRYVTLPLVGIGVAAGVMAAKFQRQMSLISTQAGGSAKEVGRLEGAVLKMAEHSKFGPEALAKALFFVRSAGLKGAQAMRFLWSNVKLATAGNSDLEHTVFGTAGAMNALGKEGKNFNRIMAIMNATVGHGHMRMEELVGAMSTGLVGAAKSFGLNFRGMGSAVAFFTRMGEPAQQAATRLRMTISHLASAATEKAAKAIESIGMNFDKMGASIRKNGTIGPVIKELAEHLSKISPARANNVLTEAFGGGRFGTQIREATQNVALFIRTEREIGKSSTAKKFGQAFKEATHTAQVELQTAWSSVEAGLVRLGEVILPAVVPLLKGLAGLVGAIATGFAALPGPAQSFLVAMLGLAALAGPLALVASSILKMRIMLMLLPGAGGSAMGGAKAMAMGLMGGLAKAIPYAAAAYGIGNVVSSAVGGDTRGALLKGGYAAAGGVLGSIFGPAGTMVGIGAGSALGGAVSKLFGSEKQLTSQQQRLAASGRQLTLWLQKQRTASASLQGANQRLRAAQHSQATSTQAVSTARKHLQAVMQEYGAHSRPTLHAELRLTEALEAHRRAIHRLEAAERKHGTALQAYRTITNHTMLEERHRITLLQQLAQRQEANYHAAQKNLPGSAREVAAAAALQRTLGKLSGATKTQAQTLQDAARQGGAKYAHWLQHANQEQLRLGGGMKEVTTRANRLAESLERLGAIEAGRREGLGLRPHHRHIPHGASGFSNFRGGLALVGEQGPELAFLSRGTNLLPAAPTRRALDSSAELRGAVLRLPKRQRGDRRPLKIFLGRRELTEAVIEEQHDEEARQ